LVVLILKISGSVRSKTGENGDLGAGKKSHAL
jgi:hypothetical protein